MKLSSRYQYNVLCEDAQTRSFVISFLGEQGVDFRKIHVNMSPAGKICGSEYVRQQYPTEAKLLSSKNYLRLVLIVVADADMMSVDDRVRFVESKVEDLKFDHTKECIIIWIPKRQIENWIHFFNDGELDENRDYQHSGKPDSCKEEARKMSDYLSDIVKYDVILPSLEFAKKEYERVCLLQM